MISSASRYASSQVVALSQDGQVVNVIVLPQPQPVTISYVTHMLTDTDRLDKLANSYYGDPTQWWRIANANPELDPDWTVLPAGTTIRVPAGG